MKHVVKGSILPTVLVVSTVMLLALLALFYLADGESLMFGRGQRKRQLQAYIDSAFLLYERDSAFMQRIDSEGVLRLFEEDVASEVKIDVSHWGLYELVKISAGEGEVKSARLLGSYRESCLGAAVYICDKGRIFTLTGESDIRGKIYLPYGGVNYGQIGGIFYEGREIADSLVVKSYADFPSINGEAVDYLKGLLSHGNITGHDGAAEERSFFSDTGTIWADRLENITLRGNIVITDSISVTVDSSAVLTDVIIAAPKVTVGSGFRGSLQIIASDSVIIGPRASLLYPSGVVIPENGGYVETGEGSEVSGYVVVCAKNTSESNNSSSREVNYRQGPGAAVRGLLFVDGTAQVEGEVTGSLYAGLSGYYNPSGSYDNVLNNAVVRYSDKMACPVWMEAGYRKKTAKWLY